MNNNDKTKICSRCKFEKDFTEFVKCSQAKDGLRSSCKECSSKYYQDNKEKITAREKQYRQDNKEKIAEYRKQYNKKYYLNNKDKYIKRYVSWRRRRHRMDSVFKLRHNVSVSVRTGIKKQFVTKNNSTWNALPYTPQQLKKHIEIQFDNWMTWKNYGEWHIDHIIPQSKLLYDSLDHPNFRKCWALENLCPLEAKENIKKGNKIVH